MMLLLMMMKMMNFRYGDALLSPFTDPSVYILGNRRTK